MIPEMMFSGHNNNGDLSSTSSFTHSHNSNGNHASGDGMTLLHHHPSRRPPSSSHGPRRLSDNDSQQLGHNDYSGHYNENHNMIHNMGSNEYPYHYQRRHDSDNYTIPISHQHHQQHQQHHHSHEPQSLRRLSGQSSGYRQLHVDNGVMQSESQRAFRHNAQRLSQNRRESYPIDDDGLHSAKHQQQQQQQHYPHPGSNNRENTTTTTITKPAIEEAPKHQLEHTWCLFMLQDAERRTQESWKESQVEVHEFSTVEDYWCMVNHIHPPSHIGVSDYSLFKKGIKPAWEDPAVAQGGRWVAKLPTKLRAVDDMWESVNLAMIGESFFGDSSSHICGAVVSIRPRSLKMSLWINCRDPQSAFHIGSEFQLILQTVLQIHFDQKDRKSVELSFQSFKDSIEYRLSSMGVFSTGESQQQHQQPQTTITPPTLTSTTNEIQDGWEAQHQHQQQEFNNESSADNENHDNNNKENTTSSDQSSSCIYDSVSTLKNNDDHELSLTTSTISTTNDDNNYNYDTPMAMNNTDEGITSMKISSPRSSIVHQDQQQ